MKKRLLCSFLSLAMVASLTACGGSNAASGSSKTESSAKISSAQASTAQTSSAASTAASDASAASSAANADIDTSEHVVITYMTTGTKPDNSATDDMLAKLNAILTEKCNAELAMYYIDWTDYLSVYNLTLAQMDGTVDLVGTATDWLDAWPNAKNGAFLELSEDMLKTYAPKTYASVPAEHWDMCKYNGEIYFIPEDNYAQWTNHGFAYRLDWAKEAGLTDGVKSWEDLTKYFEYVKKTYPDVQPWDSDGTQYGQMAGGWITSHSNYVSIDGINSGAMWGGKKDDLYTVYCPYMTDTDSLVEYAKLMKHWNEIGVWKTDVLNNTATDNREEFRAGKSAAEQHHTQTWTDLCSPGHENNTIFKDNPNAEVGFFYFGEESKNVTALSITHGAMAISAASKNPERALMVYDLIRNDPECYELFNYGIKGVQWDTNDEGLRVVNSDADAIVTDYWWGRNDDVEIKDATMNWDAIDKLYKEYDGIKIEYPYGKFIPDVDDISTQIDQINAIYTDYMKIISFGQFDGSAEDIVAEFQQKLKDAGVDDVTAELQKQLSEVYQ